MMETDRIKEHYAKQAAEFGASKQSTMKDVNIRDKEVERIIECLYRLNNHYSNPRILEIGCGNGYTAEQIVKRLTLKLTGVDFSEDLIEIARNRHLKGVDFRIGNILDLEFPHNHFDIMLSERCLINLRSWDEQKTAFNEIRRVLKIGGVYLMIEAFTDGLDSLNEARQVVGLDPIPQPFHNLYFNKNDFLEFIKDKFEDFSITHPDLSVENSENFLSTYYFGSRVLYPALIMGRKELVYNNKFVEFFKHLPAYGNYSPVQIYILEKK